MTDFSFNTLILALDGAVLALVARARRSMTAVIAVTGGLLAALGVASLFQEGTFHLFRLHAYLAFAHTPLVLLGISLIVRSRARLVAWTCLVLAGAIWATAGYAFLVEPHRLEVTHVTLPSTRVSHRIRIAVVADLQTDHIGDYEREALQATLEAHPDLILLPGDYLHDNSAARHALANRFRRLLAETDFGAPMGAFATRGNTEHNDWPDLFISTRVTPLLTTTNVELDELDVTGLDLWDSFDTSLHVPGSERFHVVFGHSPDFALGDVQADLLIAGHTHGGQVRIPFFGPPVTMSEVPRSWTAGVTRLPGNRTLVVSRGIGMERGKAPRLRLFCRPELVIIDVIPGPSDPAVR